MHVARSDNLPCWCSTSAEVSSKFELTDLRRTVKLRVRGRIGLVMVIAGLSGEELVAAGDDRVREVEEGGTRTGDGEVVVVVVVVVVCSVFKYGELVLMTIILMKA